MSADGRATLIQREGFRTKAYRDSVGGWTIGVGHTSAAGEPKVTSGLVITKAQVDEILSRDLGQYEAAVSSAVRAPLTQGQFDALVSFCFNIGVGGFTKSTVVKRLNAGDYKGAADALLLWSKPPEIMGRRRSEREQFLAAPKASRAPAPESPAPAPSSTTAIAELHPDEAISADYLRAAGSRTIAGADLVKSVATKAIGGDAVAAIVQSPDAIGKLQDAYAGFQHGADLLEIAKSYWPLLAGLVLALLIAWLAWRAIHAADKIAMARVDDAVNGLNIGR
ncbi:MULTISPECIES: lysozyme [Methylosinus]|nr:MULTISPECIES: lysozyme [Methylosinus]